MEVDSGVDLVYPGTLLGYAKDYKPGKGAYFRRGCIFASQIGTVAILPPGKSNLPIISVVPEKNRLNNTQNEESADSIGNVVPKPGLVVYGKVTRITHRAAYVDIVTVGKSHCSHPFKGIIRSHDVRATDRDSVSIPLSFRPGDIVRASVISLGDSRSFYLSTADNALGVIITNDIYGNIMVPASWDKMISLKTNQTEPRKCAKPDIDVEYMSVEESQNTPN